MNGAKMETVDWKDTTKEELIGMYLLQAMDDLLERNLPVQPEELQAIKDTAVKL